VRAARRTPRCGARPPPPPPGPKAHLPRPAATPTPGREFEEALGYVSRYWLPAKALVAAAVKGRLSVDPSGRIIKLTQARDAPRGGADLVPAAAAATL
jgi:hypothetical protein